jgi:hypothetical protein
MIQIWFVFTALTLCKTFVGGQLGVSRSTLRFVKFFVEMDNKALKALLDHVGIEASDGINLINEDTLSNLMNFTLQCLGGIRQIVHTLEKERLSKEAVGEIHSRNVTVLKETFKLAASKFLDATVSGVQINDLDPCRHLLESFPDETKFIDKRWMKLHWAITSYTDMESPEEKILQMASADPESIRELDKEGKFNSIPIQLKKKFFFILFLAFIILLGFIFINKYRSIHITLCSTIRIERIIRNSSKFVTNIKWRIWTQFPKSKWCFTIT